ncbi:calcium-translocating P-type ATPase, PMCA-type [Acetivibrio thermocellus]|nr:calcium-translocating P-type ATPase, PMCA-type [Acetivibrio thermocellus]UWV48505.1 calcium-translocating P-type ATPase, PMCA-type [Acetivibrio thermocellus]
MNNQKNNKNNKERAWQMKHYFESVETVLEHMGSSKNGIDPKEASLRLEKYGRNKLDEGKKKTVFGRFLDQLKDPMIIVLIVAAIISGFAGEPADSIIILMVVLINSILGVVQEGKAEKAIEALQKMSSPYSKVRRNGRVMQIKSEEIVPGDIVLLEAGDAVPADMRIIEASSLKIEEASLTGESIPIEKDAGAIPPSDKDIPLGDRRNMAYMGTNVVYGRGEGIVVNTGMSTEMGKIANIISGTEEEKTPLQKKLAELSKVLSIAVLGICIFIFVFGVLKNGGFSGNNVLEMFLLAISLAVAAIPEGLVAVVTIVLSIGVTKMSKRNAIIRRLTAVETLGCTQIICSDKTGTLTQNKMTVVDSFGDVEKLAVSMALCNDAALSGENGEVIGEPTESALVRYAFDMGVNKNELEKSMPRVAEAPFDSMRKMMSTVHKTSDGKFIQYTKGAPDELLKKCTHILTKDGVVPLTDKHRTEILNENKRMANKALRVLASAMKETDTLPSDTSPENLERDLTFIGLAGMIDPVRPEVKAAIEECRDAGIRPIMITGDHKDTAVAIAKELGIISDESQAITGAELSEISDSDFEEKVNNYSVYARVQPEHKVRIVNAWKKRGKITAMTGDGVNDAPALKSADIGVGMGITGTDVTKNVSDMVLADDNFASIVHAVEEGRRIYDNIRKSIQFLLSSNLSEVIALFIATLRGFILFSPIHILWINLVTDSLPAIALGMEEAEEDIMKRPPRSAKEGIFAHGLGFSVIYQGIAIAALTLISYFIGNTQSHITGTTMAFLTMSVCEVFQALNLRSMTKSIFRLKTRNKVLFGAMVMAFVLSLFVIYVPGINDIFKLTPLSGANLLVSIALAFAIIPIVETVKFVIYLIKKA